MIKRLLMSILMLNGIVFGGEKVVIENNDLSINVNGNTSLFNKDFPILVHEDKSCFRSAYSGHTLATLKCTTLDNGFRKSFEKTNYDFYEVSCLSDKCNVKVYYTDISTVPSKKEYDKGLSEAQNSRECKDYAPVQSKVLQFDVKLNETITKDLDNNATISIAYKTKK